MCTVCLNSAYVVKYTYTKLHHNSLQCYCYTMFVIIIVFVFYRTNERRIFRSGTVPAAGRRKSATCKLTRFYYYVRNWIFCFVCFSFWELILRMRDSWTNPYESRWTESVENFVLPNWILKTNFLNTVDQVESIKWIFWTP